MKFVLVVTLVELLNCCFCTVQYKFLSVSLLSDLCGRLPVESSKLSNREL